MLPVPNPLHRCHPQQRRRGPESAESDESIKRKNIEPKMAMVQLNVIGKL